jgi:DNA-binding transcriptional regulator/RsmH inhibitor MraZ
MVVIGALDKLEFWNPEDWNRFLEEADPAMEEVAESLQL